MRILNLSPFSLFPIDQGGKLRIATLNKYLSKHHTIHQFSCNFFKRGKKIPWKSWTNTINKSFIEYVYSPPQAMAASFILHKLKISPLNYLNEYLAMNAVKLPWDEKYDIIQVEGPWMFRWAKKRFPNTPIVHSSHNVEYILTEDKKNFQAGSPFHKHSVKKVFEIEKEALERAALTFVCSEKDEEDFVRVYKPDKKKLVIVPNGVDTDELESGNRKELKKKHNLDGKTVILYVSGVHAPNVDALEFILKFAKNFSRDNTLFVVAGSVGDGRQNTENVRFTGWMPHDEILDYFKLADIALSPIRYGSGTDIKLLQYLAAGIPTIATAFGARGIDHNNKGILIRETQQEYIDAINELLDNEALQKKLVKEGKSIIKGSFDYETITRQVETMYEGIIKVV